MTSQPLETIPEAPTPTPTPARVTADPPKTKPAKTPGAWQVAKGWPNATAWQEKPRKRQKQRLLSPRQPKPRLVRATPQLMTTAAAASL